MHWEVAKKNDNTFKYFNIDCHCLIISDDTKRIFLNSLHPDIRLKIIHTFLLFVFLISTQSPMGAAILFWSLIGGRLIVISIQVRPCHHLSAIVPVGCIFFVDSIGPINNQFCLKILKSSYQTFNFFTHPQILRAMRGDYRNKQCLYCKLVVSCITSQNTTQVYHRSFNILIY